MIRFKMNSGRPPAINGVVETALHVNDLDRAVTFYRDILGLRSMKGEPDRFHAFDAGAGRVLLLFERGSTLTPATTPGGIIPPHDGHGANHVGFAIAEPDYESWKSRLQSLDVPIESEVRWPRGGRSIYFRDPDGHLLELITPGIWESY
jgi:catechol 2,3-dioxygenase-like lactoylglutathione lyase family enzyme